MRILVIGGGGREHAMVWKLKQSTAVERIWCAPGNGGIAQDADCLPLDLSNVGAAAELALHLEADLTIVGPELPLVLGIADVFASRGLKLLGPSRAAARLEGSKIFAKQFMQRHQIPTASVYGICNSSEDAREALDRAEGPLVIKADGLCAGKGVLVTSSDAEAADFVNRAIDRREFGSAGERLLIEQGLRGEELSYMILTDGEHFMPMAPARDHKRAYDNDVGPNTGGMGAYSSDGLLSPELERVIVDAVVHPTLNGLHEEGIPYRGFLYFGLMITHAGPKVLEYNCRLGDPEAQAVLLRADFDMAEACFRAASGNLDVFFAQWFPGASACVVLASEGYPGQPVTGRPINGLDEMSESSAALFHAATRKVGDAYYTTGGRVLGVAARGQDLSDALGKVYPRIATIRIEGAFYRKDIGAAVGRGRAVAPA